MKKDKVKNKISKLDHVNFTIKNFTESVNWYLKVFNFELVEKGTKLDGSMWGILKSGDSLLAISEWTDEQKSVLGKTHVVDHFGLKLRDKEEWLTTMKKYKLKTYYNSPVCYPNSTSWYVKDPSGNDIEVAIWKGDKVVFSSIA